MAIPILDLFAGPGGLGEGFSSRKSENGTPLFKIKLSIEMDDFAHQTLELRAFYRQFTRNNVPDEYYDYMKGNVSKEDLFKKYKTQSDRAKQEAWKIELGGTKTDPEDVRSRIEKALDGAKDWVLIGGPPCQAYSIVGRSVLKSQGEEKYKTDHRHFLYKQYLKILADHQPSVFVMENVKGLLSSERIKGQNTFDLILSDLKNPLDVKRTGSNDNLTYLLFSFSKKRDQELTELEPGDFVVHSEEFGIPQARHRIFIFGIRSDFYKFTPDPLQEEARVSINEVINDLPRLRSGLSKEFDSDEVWREAVKDIANAKWLATLSPEMQKKIIDASNLVRKGLSRGKLFIASTRPGEKPRKLHEWYLDMKLAGYCNHETRGHIRSDLHRYFFAAVYAKSNKRSPTLGDFPSALLPNHGNVQEALDGSKFNDRFRVQVAGRPSTTVISHISKDGHYYIHYDSSQCRSLTVREAARLQTFPDNYFFEGNRTQQYHQVGNAVPPLLAYKIAAIVYQVLKNKKP